MKLIQDLNHNAKKYDFAQAMRLLSRFITQSPDRIQVVLKAEAMPTGNTNEIQYFSLKNKKAKLRLAKRALSGVKGVIPFYIYEELLAALHNDDHALKDFLDVFNQRYFELISEIDRRRWLLIQNELTPDKSALLNQFAALKNEHGSYFQYSFLLSQSHRNLMTLHQMLNDYFPYSIKISTKPYERRQLPNDSLTRLGTKPYYNSRIGQGFLLGKTCLTHFSHIIVSVTPKSEQELIAIQHDSNLAHEMRRFIQHYLRDQTPISIYLKVKRAYLSRPTVSSHNNKAARLGEVDCLAPERKPQQLVSILLK